MREPPPPTLPALLSVALLLAVAVASCGDGGRTFTAREFVAEANRNGAHLKLGEPLTSTDGEDRIYAVALGPRRGDAAAGTEHGGGSLRVSEGADAARAEYERCESAVLLLCFRAANVVVILEQETRAAELTRLADAIRAMRG